MVDKSMPALVHTISVCSTLISSKIFKVMHIVCIETSTLKVSSIGLDGRNRGHSQKRALVFNWLKNSDKALLIHKVMGRNGLT
jgi:hypothetical protein